MDLRETGDRARHPWELARSRFLIGRLRAHRVLATAHRVADLGAGDAWFAEQLLAALPPNARVTCCDAGYADADLAAIAQRGRGRLVPVRDLPADTFDLALALDVAEHVADDRALVADLASRIRPAGWLLFTVPAWQALFTEHDRFLQHHRRYAPRQARELLVGAGLTILASGGLFHGLLAPRAAGKLAEIVAGPRAAAQSAIVWRAGKAVTAGVLAGLRADNAVSAAAAVVGVELPGLSWWALCRKP